MNLALPLKSEAKQETEQAHQSVKDDRMLVIQVNLILCIISYSYVENFKQIVSNY